MDIQALVSGNIPPAPALEFAADSVAAVPVALLIAEALWLWDTCSKEQAVSSYSNFLLFLPSCVLKMVCWLTWSQWITRGKKKDELGDCFRRKSPVFSRIWGKKDVSWWCTSMAGKNPNATLNCHSILKIILKDSACANPVPQTKTLQSKTPYCHLPQNSNSSMTIIDLEVLIFRMTVLSIQG